MTTTRTLELADADIVYDVHGPLPAADGRPPLLMIGQPMTAAGFGALASHFPDRTVVTYDPRGLGRSTSSPTAITMRVGAAASAAGSGR
jgi:pimeloyl-ACP methyl ester carboxylesterase